MFFVPCQVARVVASVFAIVWLSVGASTPASAGMAGDCDDDSDTVICALDNCVSKANAGQLFCDSDSDGYGNACDTDFNQSFTTNIADFGLFKQSFGQPGETDLNCSGTTSIADFGLFKQRFGLPPGPSGLSCAGTIPCN